MRLFNSTGWTAVFSGTETEIGRMRPVKAWEETTGMALVVDPQRGALRPVTDWPDFSHLERAERIVGVIPGNGWRAHWDDEDGGPVTEAILAWLIHARGGATPITVDANGNVESAELADRIIPPGLEVS